MLHSLIIKVKFSSFNKADIRKSLIHTESFTFWLSNWSQIKSQMDALTSFIVVIIAITVQFSLYAIKRLQEPLEPDYLIDQKPKRIKNYAVKYWKNAEITNGRLAMIGFLALIINYGFFGWIIPGFI